jgi:hypothetical protein
MVQSFLLNWHNCFEGSGKGKIEKDTIVCVKERYTRYEKRKEIENETKRKAEIKMKMQFVNK